MVLYLIGLGLGDEKDITVRGLEALRSCSHVFLEEYTAILTHLTKDQLESFYQLPFPIQTADRHLVESNDDLILAPAKTSNVALLVVGDPFAATTHADLLLRAEQKGVEVRTIHNASIMNACAATGMQLYAFGQTISIPFFSSSWRPDSFYFKIATNAVSSFHTLCLLDIKVKEQSPENIAKDRLIFEESRFMTVNQAIQQLRECEERHRKRICLKESKAFGIARIGHDSQQIISGTLAELEPINFGPPLHSLVICSPELHEIEEEMWEYWHWNRSERKGQREQEKREKREKEEEKQRQEYLERKKKEQGRKNKLVLEEEEKRREKEKKEEEARKTEEKDVQREEDDDEGPVEIEPML